MQRHQRFIFGDMGGQKEESYILSKDPIYLHNMMVLEIASNWSYVYHLMVRITNKLIKTVSKMESEWITFMIQNNVDVNKYGEDSDKFIKDLFKIIN